MFFFFFHFPEYIGKVLESTLKVQVMYQESTRLFFIKILEKELQMYQLCPMKVPRKYSDVSGKLPKENQWFTSLN